MTAFAPSALRSLLTAATLAGLIAGAPSALAAPCLVLEGGQVLTPDGWLEGADVVIAGERIRAVGGSGPAGDGCARLDVSGRLVTPGLTEVHSQLGLVEISLEDRTVDTDLKAAWQDPSEAIRASVRPELAFNPRSSLLPIARSGGVTSAIVVPRGGVVSGRSFWVDLIGGRQADGIVRAPLALHASLGAREESRAAAFHTLSVALEEARAFARRARDWEANRSRPFLLPHVELRALEPVARGELPLVVHLDRAADIEGLLAMTRDSPLRLVVYGGAEAWLVREDLAARGVAVAIDPLRFGPGSFDQLHARPDNAALLHEAGVTVMFSTFGSHGVRRLRQLAGNAVREGLPREAALRAITEAPARVFGLTDHGRLSPGAVANVVVWSGDPLELGTRVERVFVHGKELALVDRQTRLRDRYRRLPPARP